MIAVFAPLVVAAAAAAADHPRPNLFKTVSIDGERVRVAFVPKVGIASVTRDNQNIRPTAQILDLMQKAAEQVTGCRSTRAVALEPRVVAFYVDCVPGP